MRDLALENFVRHVQPLAASRHPSGTAVAQFKVLIEALSDDLSVVGLFVARAIVQGVALRLTHQQMDDSVRQGLVTVAITTSRAQTAADIRDVLRQLSVMLTDNRRATDHRLQRVLALVGTEYVDPDLTVSILAKAVNLSPSRLEHLLKRHTGKTFTQCLEDARIRRAQSLLRNTFLSVKQIAHTVGFNSDRTFQRAFRRRCRCSASAYRDGAASACDSN
jgi:AraC family transcriptional regulator of arabinose operon